MEEISNQIDVVVKTMSNDSYNVSVDAASSVNSLKGKIQEITAIEIDRQRLIYRGRVLVDESAVRDYHIENGQTIHMVARPANYRDLQRNAAAPPQQPAPEQQRSGGVRSFTAVPSSSFLARTIAEGAAARSIFQTSSMEILASGSSNQTPLTAAAVRPPVVSLETNLENIRQSMLTMNTLLSNHARQPESSIRSLQFYIGQWVDVKDTVNQWLEATIMNINLDRCTIFVHYNGWPQRWDEWISIDSPRIAPFRSRTSHSVFGGNACPSPNVIPTHAQRTGVQDIRTLLPELNRMYQSMQPMLEELNRVSLQDMQRAPVINNGSMNIAEGMPWQEHSLGNNDSDSKQGHVIPPHTSAESKTEQAPAESKISGDDEQSAALQSSGNREDLLNTYREICPLLDRFGRTMTDMASFLWTEVEPQPVVTHPTMAGMGALFANTSFEGRLLNLLRDRPPSPPPQRAFHAPLHSFLRPEDTTGGGPLHGLGGAGSNGEPQFDVHIAIYSPPDAAPLAAAAASGMIPGISGAATSRQSSASAGSTGGVDRSTNTNLSAAMSSSSASTAASSSSTTYSSAGLTRSMANIASSLQQQAQELAARTEQLSERTQTVSEISTMLGEIMRAHSLGRQGQDLLQRQSQLQQAAAAVAAASGSSVPAEAVSQAEVEDDREDKVPYDEENEQAEDDDVPDLEDLSYNEEDFIEDSENALYDGDEDSHNSEALVVEDQAQQPDLSDLIPADLQENRATLLPSTIPPVADSGNNKSSSSHCPADDSFWNVPNPL